MKIGLVQLDSGEEIEANLQQAERFLREAAGQGAKVIALPEVMHLRVGRAMADRYLESAEPIPGPMTQRFGELAKELGTYLLLGSIGEQSEDPKRIYNTSVLLAPDGTVAATYRKVHLFDVVVDEDNADKESDRYPHQQAVLTENIRPSG